MISAVSSGRGGEEAYREVYLRGLENAIALPESRPRALRQQHFGLRPERRLLGHGGKPGGAALRQPAASCARRRTSPSSTAGIVARLAGIYGPGRSVLLRKFLDKTAVIEGDGSRHINQIHADDAAAALFHLIAHDLPPGIYNVADDCPVTQLACYEWLAERLGQPLPPRGPIDPNRKRGVTDKRVSNAKLRSLGWTPNYPSFREALERDAELLAAARADGSGDAPP